MKILLVLLATLLTSNCNSNSTEKMSEPAQKDHQFDFQGHRGARGLYPENTIKGFIKALEYGVTTLELDVVISKDNQVVVSHEPWMSHHICSDPDGNAISKKQEDEYIIYQMTYDEIKTCDCGSRGNERFPEQVKVKAHKPLLKDVFNAVEDYLIANKLPEVDYNIETKCLPQLWSEKHVPPAEEFTRLVNEIVQQSGMKERIIIQSFNPETLQHMRKLDPEVRLALLIENMKTYETNIENLGFQPEIYSPMHMLVSERLLEKAHRDHTLVIPWTVNETKRMQKLIGMGVDGIITDYPDRLAKVLEELGM